VSAAAQAKCPTQFTACVDLASRVSWLQHDGHITYGPVRVMPGAPVNPTPTGHFVVQWKDKDHISGEYHTPMPYSVFFAAGGVAFHQGSLTQGSHGCVHLSAKDAAYYFAHLPVGVQVAVF